MIYISSLCELAILALVARVAQAATANYVIFGGTSAVVRTRLDPIVNPGSVGPHVHDVFGGSGFSNKYDYNQSIQSNCTSMEITEDFSNYWVPSMYYVDPSNGSYTLMRSTMNIYYLIRPGPKNDKVQAFPEGLRMFAGDNSRGTYNASNLEDQAVSYMCLDYNNNHANDPAWAESPSFFEHQCPDGMRAQVFFPSCWDGKNLDSDDHKSHMSYPIGAYNDGYCPDSHPVHLISLFYELFTPTGDYPYHGPGSWMLANGDSFGYRFHGDFTMGWRDVNLLQQFVDDCPNAQGNVKDCPALAAKMDTDAAAACQFQGEIVDEDIGMFAPIMAMPGCNKPWNGNGTKPTCENEDSTSVKYVQAIQALPTGWSELGCIAEGTSGRALTNASYTGTNMTKSVCSAMCANGGYQFAGTEFGNQCYCGDSLMNGASQTTVPAEKCHVRCSANPFETCGGESVLLLTHNPNPTPVDLPPSGGNSTSGGWTLAGCVKDGSARALTGYSFASDKMTPSLCQDGCSSKGFSMAGMEYGSECFCGNAFSNNLGGSLSADDCSTNCSGDATQKCGGDWALSLYKRPVISAHIARHKRRSH